MNSCVTHKVARNTLNRKNEIATEIAIWLIYVYIILFNMLFNIILILLVLLFYSIFYIYSYLQISMANCVNKNVLSTTKKNNSCSPKVVV